MACWEGGKSIPLLPAVRSTGYTWKVPVLQSSNALGHRRLFWAVACSVVSPFFSSLQLLQYCALFLFQPHLISVVSASLGFSFVYVCVWLFWFFFFFFCWIFVSVLEFLVLPTISHGKSKDGIQPFKGPKPAARIANSLANRVYWAAYRGWHPPVPSTFPSLHRAPQLKPPNRTAYLKPSTRSRLSASLKNSRKN